MDKSNSFSSPMRRSIRLINAKRNGERSPIKFMTSAEAITVSDSETSSDEMFVKGQDMWTVIEKMRVSLVPTTRT
ncbi:unnamed protein product [Rhodiola kirilowii]